MRIKCGNCEIPFTFLSINESWGINEEYKEIEIVCPMCKHEHIIVHYCMPSEIEELIINGNEKEGESN